MKACYFVVKMDWIALHSKEILTGKVELNYLVFLFAILLHDCTIHRKRKKKQCCCQTLLHLELELAAK